MDHSQETVKIENGDANGTDGGEYPCCGNVQAKGGAKEAVCIVHKGGKWPRHEGCVKPKRASRKSVEEPLSKRGEERKVPEESDKVVKKRRGPNVSKAAQED